MKLSKISTKAPKSANKEETKAGTAQLVEELGELQKILYAQGKHRILIILQGMDASGKDGTISSVFKGINPLGCRVQAFKKPSEEEAAHDFLWRVHPHVPGKGMIHIFNRSHYEAILVGSVNKLAPREEIKKYYRHINDFEQLLVDNNTLILKFYLHVSREEQAARLEERKTNPKKFWKHSDHDAVDAARREDFIKVYEQIFDECSEAAEWHIIPGDQNWYRDHVVAKTIVKEMKKLKLKYV
ncbi:MAG: polyphosphate kinase [Bacteroidetes bacterium]|jgi:PPK2 family polyphosphate:nucleotide phosphotransferase|nr:polyphosphate kinase [Bacteroidota bacterium]